jgi:hypothetical protein
MPGRSSARGSFTPDPVGAAPLVIDGATPAVPEPEPRGCLSLEGEAADRYLARLRCALHVARPNSLFPPARALDAHLSFLGPAGSEQLYPALGLSPHNGLPTAREILRVKIDRDLAAEFLAGAAARPAPPPASKLARRIAYYARLARAVVMPLDRMQLELRSVDRATSRALLRLTLDRFDLAGNQFVRHTVLLAQRDRGWQRPHVALDEADLAAPSEAFRRATSRFASHEAEVAFILLSQIEGIEVEDVRRCRVGPLLLPGAEVGAQLEQLLDPRRGPCAAAGVEPFILCLPEDRAGIEVAEHAGLDPLAPLMRDALSDEARALVEAKAEELGYRVAKSRKFVCPMALVEPLRALCRELGAPSMVRGMGA